MMSVSKLLQPLPNDLLKKSIQLCFFISGFSALVFEIIWIRMLGWIMGTTLLAISTTVTAFMAGLALGSYFGGRWVDRNRDILLGYFFLEALVGVFGMTLSLMFPNFIRVASIFSEVSPHWLVLIRFIITFSLLLVPTTLMGATLPILSRYLVGELGSKSDESSVIGDLTGSLYAYNTGGAVFGALVTDFLFIPSVGLSVTGLIAALGNFTVASLVLFLRLRQSPSHSKLTSIGTSTPISSSSNWVFWSFFLSGFCALSYEVFWSRIIVFFVEPRIFTFSIILAVLLTGLAVGSFIIKRYADRHSNPTILLAASQGVLGCLGILSMFSMTHLSVLAPLVRGLATTPWSQFLAGTAAACFFIMFPAAILMGVTFPIYVRLGSVETKIGESVGKLYAFNTVGSAFGSLIAGFFLLPYLGLQKSLILIGTLNLLLAYQALVKTKTHFGIKIIATAILIIIPSASMAVGDDYVISHTYRRPVFGELKFIAEDVEGSVLVSRTRMGDGSFTQNLIVNGTVFAGDTFYCKRYMKLEGYLPVLLHRDPQNALVICVGTGTTLSAVAAVPQIRQIDAVDLSPSVIKALDLFSGTNNNIRANPRVHFHVDDGRNFLVREGKKYDVITFEPPPPEDAGVVNLYSREYYQICKEHLNPGGLICQWLPVEGLTRQDMLHCIKAFTEVFPHTTLWSSFATSQFCLVGSPDPISLDVNELSKRMANPTIAQDLHSIGINSVESFLSTFLKNDAALRSYSRNAASLTDDRPLVEYSYKTDGQPEIDLNWFFLQRESVTPLVKGTLNVTHLRQAEKFQEAIYQFDILGFEHGPRWLQDLWMDRMVQIEPNNSYVFNLYGSTDAALQSMNAQLSQSSTDSELLFNRAEWYRSRKNWNAAERDLLEYHSKRSDSVTLFSLGMLQILKGQPERSRQWLIAARRESSLPELNREIDQLLRDLSKTPKDLDPLASAAARDFLKK